MHSGGLKLSLRHRLWLHGSLAVLFFTGVGWWLLHDFVQVETDFGPRGHPLASWSLKLHGLAALVSLVVLGSLVPLHMRRGWLAHRNRWHGGILVAVLFLLTLTGYGLYYSGLETLREISSWAHRVLGLLLPAIIALHIRAGRRSSRGH